MLYCDRESVLSSTRIHTCSIEIFVRQGRPCRMIMCNQHYHPTLFYASCSREQQPRHPITQHKSHRYSLRDLHVPEIFEIAYHPSEYQPKDRFTYVHVQELTTGWKCIHPLFPFTLSPSTIICFSNWMKIHYYFPCRILSTVILIIIISSIYHSSYVQPLFCSSHVYPKYAIWSPARLRWLESIPRQELKESHRKSSHCYNQSSFKVNSIESP